MNDISVFNLELTTPHVDRGEERAIPSIAGLVIDFIHFKNEVNHFYASYQGPDYFDIQIRLFELQLLINSFVEQLVDKVGTSPIIRNRDETDHLELRSKEKNVPIRTDLERISNVVAELGNLIQLSRKAALEARGIENFFLESMLTEITKEMEKSRWIFCMFSKY